MITERTERIYSHSFDASVQAAVVYPENIQQLREAISRAVSEAIPVCPIGGRNSFGHPFLMEGSLSVDMTRLAGIISFDADTGMVEVWGGTRITDILAITMPRGFILPALSGSMHNTIGGNISSDIHGKDSWKRGNFCSCVVSFDLMTADGTVRTVDRESDPGLFHAVTGGMGLLGFITRVAAKLVPIPSTELIVRKKAIPDLAAAIGFFQSLQPELEEFAYIWVDPYGKGRSLGRGLAQSARFNDPSAGLDVPSLSSRKKVAGMSGERFWRVVGSGFRILERAGLHRLAWRSLNAFRYHRWRLGPGDAETRQDFMSFQYPLTYKLPNWNYRFYPDGFHEIQFFLPEKTFAVGFSRAMSICHRYGLVPEICAIRKLKPNPGFLSFSGKGYTTTVNYSLYRKEKGKLDRFIRELMQIVIDGGGRIYLPKFSLLLPEEFRSMYPGYREFLSKKKEVDPEGRIVSMTSIELGLSSTPQE